MWNNKTMQTAAVMWLKHTAHWVKPIGKVAKIDNFHTTPR